MKRPALSRVSVLAALGPLLCAPAEEPAVQPLAVPLDVSDMMGLLLAVAAAAAAAAAAGTSIPTAAAAAAAAATTATRSQS